ncbi:hypothetical protein D9611_013973 [Ephemerocybe angulata]|uniref:F-box domain-containing protein n=1 Tax=Ephemerocybe angulata TaxID=980116 RepID=A0A8H5ERM4_9AGAR|nr:hypothetical protein D9611_013973 [Tulosesus angulatus]
MPPVLGSQPAQPPAVFSSLSLEALGRILEISATDYKGNLDISRVAALCLVCKAFRKAALLTHRLWTDVSTDGSVPLHEAMAWLKRSDSLPKTLRFTQEDLPCDKHDNWSEVNQGDDGTSNSSQCVLIAAQALQCAESGVPLDSLCITPSSPACVRDLLLSSPSSHFKTSACWSSLRSLNLNMEGCKVWPDPETDLATSMFNHLPPSLSSLGISLPYKSGLGDSFDDTTQPINIPPSIPTRLTSFRIQSDWEGPQAATLLQHCMSLERLTIEYMMDSVDGDNGLPAQIFLPKLKTLKVHGISGETADTILHFLRAPTLRHIDIGVDREYKMDDYPEHPAYLFFNPSVYSPQNQRSPRHWNP